MSESAIAPLDAARTLTELLSLRAAAHPDRCAIAGSETGEITYAELEARATALAAELVGRGVVPGELVGVALPRGADAVVAMLGIMSARAAYVPLDPDHPAAHVRFVMSDAAMSRVVTTPDWSGGAADGIEIVELPDGDEPSSRQRGDAAADGSDPAYVIYTSGSTGRPKGVVVTHDNVLALLRATAERFDLGPDDRWSLFHSYSFDFAVWEMWGALAHGGRIVTVPADVAAEPARTIRLLAEHGVTVFNQVPSVFEHVVAGYAAEPVPLSLRYVVFGGEGVRLATVAAFLDAYRGGPPPQMVNMYGITEITVHATFKQLDRSSMIDPTRSPIGVALPHLDLRVVGPAGEPAADGEAGELYVAGAGVAAGYHDRPELTGERFTVADLGGGPRRYYRTGDLVRRDAAGELEYVGRTDDQVKIHGFRIEPGQVEAVLRLHPDVADAAVLAMESRLGEAMLAAFVVPDAGHTGDGASLRRTLREHVGQLLPAQYVPARISAVPSLPLTSSGKLDRAALRATAAPVAAGATGGT